MECVCCMCEGTVCVWLCVIINRARYATNDKHRSKMCLADLWEKVNKREKWEKNKKWRNFPGNDFSQNLLLLLMVTLSYSLWNTLLNTCS